MESEFLRTKVSRRQEKIKRASDCWPLGLGGH